jgi:hypothetical protein
LENLAVNDFITIRGYAAPFGHTTPYGDEWLRIAHGAFTEMLNGPRLPEIKIQWGSHDADAEVVASTGTGGVRFFQDNYGLGFSFVLNRARDGYRIGEMMRRDRPFDRCSTNFIVLTESIERVHQTGVCRVIKNATIDHVAVGLGMAAFMNTGIWPAHRDYPLDDAPWRIQEMAATWEDGSRQATAKRRREAEARPAAPASRLAAMLAPRMADYAAFRNATVAGAMSLKPGECRMFGHVAFTRAAGFKGWK